MTDLVEEIMAKASEFLEKFNSDLQSVYDREMSEINDLADQIVQKLKTAGTSSPVLAKTPFGKRKIKRILEDEDEGIKKKHRSSQKIGSQQDNTSSATGVREASTFNDILCQLPATSTHPDHHNIENLNDVSNIESGQSRTKRHASKIASAMNNKLLNEKLTQKIRRPDSRGNDSKRLSVECVPNVISSNELMTAMTKTVPMEISSSKNGLKNKNNVTAHVLRETFNHQGDNKENNGNVINSNESFIVSKIAVEKGKQNVVPDVEEMVTASLPNTRSTRSTAVNSSMKLVPVANEMDRTIMPPPVLPAKQSNKKTVKARNARSKTANKQLCVSDSEDESFIKPPPPAQKRTKNVKVEPETIQDESMEINKRVTRSSRRTDTSIVKYTEVLDERPKRTRGRKPNVVQEQPHEPAVQVGSTPEIAQPLKRIHSDSGKEFEDIPEVEAIETKKPKERAKRTRKAVITEPVSLDPVPQPKCEILLDAGDKKRGSNDSGISSSGKPEAMEGQVAVTDSVSQAQADEAPNSKMDLQTDIAASPTLATNQTFTVENKTKTNKTKQVLNETVTIEKGSVHNVTGEVIVSDYVALNQTVTISTKSQNEAALLPVFNETVTINPADMTEVDPQCSLLTDDLSEVEASPPQPLVAKIANKCVRKIKEIFESPVKSRVKHFERLAEEQGGDCLDAPSRITRTKTRAMAKEANHDEPVAEKSEEVLLAQVLTKKVSRSKLTTPVSSKMTLKASVQQNPVPVTKQVGSAVKPVHRNIMNHLESMLSPLGSFHSSTQLSVNPSMAMAVSRVDPIQKREAMMQAKAEEQRKKREQKCRAAALAREAQSKLKQAQFEKAEREKEDRARQVLFEKEKLREEKRIALERKVAEAEERRHAEERKKAEEMALIRQKQHQEEAARQLQAAKKRQQEEMERLVEQKSIAAAAATKAYIKNDGLNPISKVYKTFEQLNTDDESEDEESNRAIPLWSQNSERSKAIRKQSFLKSSLLDMLYSTSVFNPDLFEIFPKIDKKKITRSSSIVWKTPPRYSMMPMD